MLCAFAAAASLAPQDVFRDEVRPILRERCAACHAGPDAEGGLDLEALDGAAAGDRVAWSAVRKRVRAGDMPPRGETPLEADEKRVLQAWLDSVLPAETAHEPAPRGLRRLNRREYANTIRDLFGVPIEADELPADEVGHGFDTIGAVLSTSELLVETHLRLAERVAERAVLLPDAAEPPRERVDAAAMEGQGKSSGARGKSRGIYSNGEIALTRKLPRAGDYVLRARVYGEQAGDAPCRMSIKASNREVLRVDVPEEKSAPRVVESYVRLEGGTTKFAVAFLNDHYAPKEADKSRRDRNLVVEWFEIEGPIDAPELSRYQREELDPKTRGSASDAIARLLRRAWRRPAQHDEVERVLEHTRGAATFEARMRSAVVLALASPNFLYRPELPAPGKSAGDERIDPHALVARISYFLWSSTPDAELDARADAGGFLETSEFVGTLRRMIADPRSAALSEGFAKQWLQLGRLENATPDPTRFPEFDEALRASMIAEATMLFDAVLRERRPVRALLDPGFAFVDERLAKHYGIAGITGGAMRRVPLAASARGGILGMGAVLTATSYPTRTSPSSRGKFVLEALLGAPPPPPPPGVGVLADSDHATSEASLRERLERHRSDAACSSCHATIDPIGFGLENFDAIGRWRTRDGKFAVDAEGALPDGRAFSGPARLAALVADDPAFVRCLAEQLVIYALGRSLEDADRAWIRRAVADAGREPTLAGVIEELVESPEFARR